MDFLQWCTHLWRDNFVIASGILVLWIQYQGCVHNAEAAGNAFSQHCVNFLATVCGLLSSILMSLTKLVTVSITVSASNSYGFPQTWTVQGPIRSVAHSSNGIEWTSRSGRNPYPLPSNLFLGNNHTWSCQQVCVNHDYNILDVCVDRAFCSLDTLWLDDTTW